MGNRVSQAVANLPLGYFALVMSTGIISIGFENLGYHLLSLVLLWVTAVSYVALWVLFVWRVIRFPHRFVADLRNPAVAFAFFTLVAGSNVLAVRLLMADVPVLAVPLVTLAAVLWFAIGYVLPWQVLMTRDGQPILARTNGTWFIWSVASQSLAIGMTQIQPYLPEGARWVGILAVLSWSVGVALYVAVAFLVLLRLIHFGLRPEEVEAPYWVAMGAMAIAVVAGSGIVDMAPTPMVDASRALIAGTVVIFWCFAAWLIPLLVGVGYWRHFRRGVPLVYTPFLWSMVFPLGMFAVASINLGQVDRLPVVASIGAGFLFLAFSVWVAVFTAMLLGIARLLVSPDKTKTTPVT